ncbi:flagellar basal body-associated FliL family protein [Piscirickettsia salmonis]|uniref:Flagellar protein FliL n=1 Tax=Piscirickettsia salmonis TaxID=1238 RepID=A0A9Q5V940_PISSA|nr:flagellar basal body-associated FliL family protein [Piscirickettsia salmonis]RNC78302.1 flagellar basal body-associated FliL family protein [Piscirickettsiaceae bacterium NZ-RLO2]ALA25123.1 flagellar basal body-associated FliL family protein [Piscirickettsia salmonis]APS45397.1 flagellar basal body-associated FliL family protein [Piscirickettsia salmonis]APS48758.1 flagellar basal body-associated FliL family protein [Piscirickettsia salmonis]APS49997.1 flagellar basal body-associated FliL 
MQLHVVKRCLLVIILLLFSSFCLAAELAYVHIRPQFLTNLQGTTKHLYVEVTLLIPKDASVEEVINNNMPLIRSALVDLFSQQTLKKLSKKRGVNGLQSEALKTITRVLTENAQNVDIKRVLFTKFNYN